MAKRKNCASGGKLRSCTRTRLVCLTALASAQAVGRLILAADRKECYRHLATWVACRALPVAGRIIARGGLKTAWGEAAAGPIDISVDALVAGQVDEHS